MLLNSLIAALIALLNGPKQVDGFGVFGYLPEWRYEGANFALLSSQLSHLILFSLEPDAVGGIAGMDRFPRADLISEAREQTRRFGTKLMVCVGGNGRSSGFSRISRHSKLRAKFVAALSILCSKFDLDGVDYNWEYPGYVMGKGYLADSEIEKDYAGLAKLGLETRSALGANATITMAYYPDVKQESLIAHHRLYQHFDMFHAMAYDAASGEGQIAGHSPFSLAHRSVTQFAAAGLRLAQLTVGLPFYGRHSMTGDWTTYEDIVQRHHPLPPGVDEVPTNNGSIHFNGVDMIRRKVTMALSEGAGGVMIWESGQDCRLVSVTHGSTTHARTCPGEGADRSLHAAIATAIHAHSDIELDVRVATDFEL
jgi:chitinase